jgi:hypothetical protein
MVFSKEIYVIRHWKTGEEFGKYSTIKGANIALSRLVKSILGKHYDKDELLPCGLEVVKIEEFID